MKSTVATSGLPGQGNGMEDAAEALQHYFGFRTFLEGQREIVDAVMAGHNTLAIMPTGHGKSLCFQLPALMSEGVTVVVSPLISLMKDQVDALQQKGIPSTFINSSLDRSEQMARLLDVRAGLVRLLYIAPERFRAESFMAHLNQCNIALVAIDEAHCISQWGHDFRPDYVRIYKALEKLGSPQTIALTATATPEVVGDIVAQLQWKDYKKFVTGFDRPNLSFKVHYTSDVDEKYDVLVQLIQKHGKGIVYCSTRKNVEKVAIWLAEAGHKSGAYHAGLSDTARHRIQDQFCKRQIDVIVATNAFGMGIDRSDVRFVAHFNIPGNIESYYQEAGRAGRDGEPANCEVLYNHADVRTQEFFIAATHPTKRLIRATYSWLVEQCSDAENGSLEGMSLDDMREKLRDDYIDVPSVMCLSSVLTTLRKASYIESSQERQRKAWWLKSQAVPPEKLDIDFASIEKRERLARRKLTQMIELCRTDRCRRYTILAYFDDHHHARGCGICDNCRNQADREVRVGTDDEQLNIRKLLSCVARLHGEYGREKVLQVLVGSKSKEVFDAGLDALSTYGLLADFDLAYIYNLLQLCIEEELVGVLHLDVGRPIVLLTAKGSQMMKDPSSLRLRWPLHVEAKMVGGKGPLNGKGPRRASLKGKSKAEMMRDLDPRLYQRLVELRSKLARQQDDLPLYRIFPNKVLELMAQLQPKTPDELLRIKGVGPAKLRLYGEQFLTCIASHREEATAS